MDAPGCWLMIEELRALERLLRKYTYTGQAGYVARLLQMYNGDRGQFFRALKSNSMWGGAGSVCDVILGAGLRQESESRRDQREFHLALIKVAEALERQGQSDDRIRGRLEIDRKSVV